MLLAGSWGLDLDCPPSRDEVVAVVLCVPILLCRYLTFGRPLPIGEIVVCVWTDGRRQNPHLTEKAGYMHCLGQE